MVSRGSSGIAPAFRASVLHPGQDQHPAGRREVANHGHMGLILSAQHIDVTSRCSRVVGLAHSEQKGAYWSRIGYREMSVS